MKTVAQSEIYEPYIDGLRGLAILMVLVFHTSTSVMIGDPYFPGFRAFIEHLSRGVHLFFIVSALTLFRSSHFRQLSGQFSSISFYVRRAFRILPLWWLMILLQFYFLGGKHTIEDLFATLFFYVGFYRDAWFMYISPVGWSLFVEESFYLFFPIWFRRITTLSKAVIAVILSYAVAWIWYQEAWRLGAKPESNFTSIFPLGNYYAFFLGIMIYFLLEKWKNDFSNTPLSKYAGNSLDILTAIGLVAIFFFDRMMGSLALVPLVVAASFPNTWTGRICRRPWLIRFGTCCYSIYLFHGLLYYSLFWVQGWYFGVLGVLDSTLEIKTLVWLPVTISLSLAIGIFSFRFLELPIINLGKFLINRYLIKK